MCLRRGVNKTDTCRYCISYDMMDTEMVFQLFMKFCCNNIKLKYIYLAFNTIFLSEKAYATFIHKIFSLGNSCTLSSAHT